MNESETRQLISERMSGTSFLEHQDDKVLICGGMNYSLRPDESFLFNNSYFLVEYENTKRPVESISKYFWLLEKTNWLANGMPISLLLLITNSEIEKSYKMRVETIDVLGNILQKLYPNNFKFGFLRNSEINKVNINKQIDKLL